MTEAPTLHVQQGLTQAFGFRMEEELERINNAVVEINKFSKDFEEAKSGFAKLLEEAKMKLDKLYISNKKSVEKARPYYRTRLKAVEAKDEFLEAAARYRRARLNFEEARENASVAEKAFICSAGGAPGTQDPEVLVNLNKANDKVLDATRVKDEAREQQERCMEKLSEIDHQLALHHTECGKAVSKAKGYFDTRDAYQRQLNDEVKIPLLRRQYLQEAKDRYRDLFAKMDVIAAEFEQRRSALDLDFSDFTAFRDLSKFEEIEIEDMQGEVVALDDHTSDCIRRYSTDELSLDSELSEQSGDVLENGRNVNVISKSTSLDETAIRELKLQSVNDQSDLSSHSDVTFQMRL